MRVSLAALILLALASTALADVKPCDSRPKMLSELAKKYGEKPAAVAVENDGYLLELLVNDKQGTWTLLRSDRRMTCVVTAGEGWQNFLLAAGPET